jgi:hypothetical protein
LRDLSAGKFLERGAPSSTIQATVVSDDGKRTEKVAIAKSGADFVARRENEPAGFQLASAAVEDLLKAAEELKPESAPHK